MTKELNLKLIVTVLLSLFFCSANGQNQKRKVIEELTLPILGYEHTDQHTEIVPINGELVLELVYWDISQDPDSNDYTLYLTGYSDSSRSSIIFDSHLRGTSLNKVRRGQWEKGSRYEEDQTPHDNGIIHMICLTVNDLWETRCALNDKGQIVLVRGRLNDKGQIKQNHAEFIYLDGGVKTWNKLVEFLRNAHSHNIGKPQ